MSYYWLQHAGVLSSMVALFRNRTDAAMVRLITEINPDEFPASWVFWLWLPWQGRFFPCVGLY
ncbi:MAG: hypothetical protein L3J18_06600 [Candidatus Brocadia sp.]|nr:hypothetical protein [Candidatus Brocadia sp.]MDG5997357.1 hypothetical protein [Candidatus Brocadia sp.]UJS21975.1 MAG: hypothetical protein L3J18_06600 [Candidatus Brocadia sp.]